MIFKKPYAFLIKNFRVIHLIIAFVMAYLLFKTGSLYSFISNYSVKTMANLEIVNTYFSSLMFIFPVLIIILSIILLVVLYKKGKPYLFYIINIISNIVILVIYSYSYSICKQLEIRVLEVRVLKVVNDILLIALLFQAISEVITAIRAIGFDIKKFNFVKDLQELDIDTSDNEEFEVNVELDTNKMKRGYNRKKRYAKYFYLENKLIINASIFLIVGLTALFIYLGMNSSGDVYKEGSAFNSGIFTVKIDKSYITEYDYERKVINKDKAYVAVQIDVKSRTGKSSLNTALIELVINDDVYYHDTTYQSKLFDLGNMYNRSIISTDGEKYILVYEIPSMYINEDIQLRYVEFNSKNERKYYQVKLNPINLDEINTKHVFNGIDSYNITNGVLEDSTIIINKVDTSTGFINTYRYCINDNICYFASERVYPNLNTNYDKSLIKIEGSITFPDDYKAKYIYNFKDVIEYYGYLLYAKDNQVKFQKLDLGVVKTNHTPDNTCYIEIPSYMVEYDYLSIILDIRGTMYEYKIK